ncbi:hypothetical protein HD554DRAFT_1158466 [Boletus coccyginus]|nr:hypothetical protein HD554DRAFT_1158466 [Boletus coccyginus]
MVEGRIRSDRPMASPPHPPIWPAGATSSLISLNEMQIEYSSPLESEFLAASPFGPLYVLDATSPMYGWQQNDAQFHPGSTLAQGYRYPGQDENTGPPLPSDHASDQDTRNKFGLLDTRQWSPSPTLPTSYATSRSQFPSMVMDSHWHAPPHVVFNGFTGSFAPVGMPARVAPEPQVVPDLGLGFSNSTRYHYASPVPNLEHSICHVSALTSSPASTEHDAAKFVSNRGLPPIVIHRSPEKKGSGRRRCQRACAVNIGGMWIDKEDLFSRASQDNPMIRVHKCWWAKSGDPCEMWIVGSRTHVGAHIQKWHRQEHADTSSAVRCKCLWSGCTTSKAMRNDSINRHIVSVHLGEGFHCQGCDKEFSRGDVYDKHVQNGDLEVCRDVGAVIVYGAEHRVIDARQAFQQTGVAVRYAAESR